MKIVENTLKANIETWSDPGDYPSGAGAGPLPSYDYLEDIYGELVIEIEKSDLEQIIGLEGLCIRDDIAEIMSDIIPDDIQFPNWKPKLEKFEIKESKLYLVISIEIKED